MAESTLTVTPAGGGSGQGTNTGSSSLQSSGASNLNGAQSKDFQPGITGDSLKSNQGITLNPTALSTVDLSSAASTTTASQAVAPVQSREFNPLLLGVSALLLAAAVIMYWAISRSGKKHNQYN